jgi:thymidylate synthase (FAD)
MKTYTKIPCLDHGFVQLKDLMGDDSSIVRSARVSHAANEKTGQDKAADDKLIHYLYKNGHTSPFEHVSFTFQVKAPIFIFRQWHRHRTWSYNEVSARYTELPAEFYVPAAEHIGEQDTKNHQSRGLGELRADAEDVQLLMQVSNERSHFFYRELLKKGVPRELARTVLPVATYSEMYATVDLHNLFKFLNERLAPGAQYEIRVYAEALLQLIRPYVPVAISAWESTRNKETV